ncbi:MAG: PAS domain-containing protein [Sphingomonas sp.]|uniref:PAS domain-containing protein n=1 Tax=Sphingomonas sp. TaxID=28214 RepID=UPI001B170755|nr:PAS domain-containing protein [Sphingomonas sp.]MBO9622205.1 PAS domain-containing protein [Sphingomonas sp.]
MPRRIREHDWASTPLGPIEQWPQALRFALNIALGSSFPTAIYWGPEFHLLYNDAWAPIPADRHPWALGRRGEEVWPDIWHLVGPQMQRVLETGQGFAVYDRMLPMERDGKPQETWWNYSFTAIRDENGNVVGVLNQGNETTRLVLAERARAAEIERLRQFFEQAPGAVALLQGPEHVFEIANPAYLALIGRSDVLGKPVVEVLPEVIEQGFVALLDRVYQSGEAHREDNTPVRLRRAPGAEEETRYVDFVYQPVRDAAGTVTGIFVLANDVTERALAEAALRSSEERLQLALGSTVGVGTWLWEMPQNRITADDRFLRLFGVEDAAPDGSVPIDKFFAPIHPDDLPRVRAAIMDAITTGARYAEEYRVVQPNGSVHWISAQGRCAFDAEGRPKRFPGVVFDITERKTAEEAARTAAEELRRATEAQSFLHELAERQRNLDSSEAIMWHTANALSERLHVERVGFYWVEQEQTIHFGPCTTHGSLPPLTGTMTVEELGTPAADQYCTGGTLVARDTAREPRFAGTSFAARTPSAIGVPLMRGGRWVGTLYVNDKGARDWTQEEIAFVEAVAEISWDAVERAAALAGLRESEAKFRAIANSIDQMVWSTLPDGHHDYYNDRWYEFTGVPYGSTDGDRWQDIFHPEDRVRATSLWRHCLATGETYHIEYRLRHHSGEYRWVLGRAQPVRDRAGGISRWFGTCTDIQDIVDAREVLARSREELEAAVRERTEQLMTTEEQLRQAQKMEAVGQLTGGIAHDFNNMLAVVIGALDLLERRIAQGRTDVDRYVTAARDGATRAAALTQRLLAFSRQQPLAPLPVDANAMIEGMIELLVRTLGEAVTVETRLRAGLWIVMADPNQLENAVLNLSVNARDAMPDGGTLVIESANRVVAPDRARALGIEPGDYVELTVSDSGSGMSPEVAARAFDPFFTTKGVGQGTGLGLSQVFGFVRQSGGTVRIDTAAGRGTTVRLYLPARHDAVPAATAAPAGAEVPRAHPGETVLVVEDEERVRAFSIEALRELGYAVADARDGREALRMIDRGQQVSLLFTDVVMPEMTGHELAKQARARLPELKVLLTSGYSPEVAGTEEAILTKPFSLEDLAQRVRATLDGPGGH